MTDIFISYRRADSQEITEKLYKALSNRYGKKRIYFDTESNESGDSFSENILEAINSAKVILIVISEKWATIQDENGNNRLFNENDWVRQEAYFALNKRNPQPLVIPVLVNGASMPQKAQLPVILHKLTEIHAHSQHTQTWRKDVSGLISRINRSLESKPAPTDTPPPLNQAGGLLAKFRRLSLIWKVAIAVLGLLATLATIFSVLPEAIREDIWNSILPSTTIIEEIKPKTPQILSNSQTFLVDSVAKDPTGLLLAPSHSGFALWGYSDAESTLFALDIATGTPIEIWDAPEGQDATRYPLADLYERAVIVSLHYDGEWLWVGDSRHHRLLAFDPLTLTHITTYEFGDDSDPIGVLSVDNTLWVMLSGKNEVVGLTIDHANTIIRTACLSPIQLSGVPTAITQHGDRSLFVATGGDAPTLTQIETPSCEDNARTFRDEKPALALFSMAGTAYMVTEKSLYKILDNGVLEPMQFPFESDITIQTVTAQNPLLWLSTTSGKLIALNLETQLVEYEFTLDIVPSSLMSVEAQIWFASEDNSITRYVIPQYVYPNAMYTFAYDDSLWIIDEAYQVCNINNLSDCVPIGLTDKEITAISINTTRDELWVGTEDGQIWLFNLATKKIALWHSGLVFPIRSIAQESTTYLWLTDGFANLVAIDLQTNLPINALTSAQTIRVPQELTFDNNQLWFGYLTPAKVVHIAFQDTILRELLPSILLDTPNNLQAIHVQAHDNMLFVGVAGILYISDTNGNILSTVGVDNNISDITIVDDAIWVLNRQNDFLFRLSCTVCGELER